jgi:hypothetical protein
MDLTVAVSRSWFSDTIHAYICHAMAMLIPKQNNKPNLANKGKLNPEDAPNLDHH